MVRLILAVRSRDVKCLGDDRVKIEFASMIRVVVVLLCYCCVVCSFASSNKFAYGPYSFSVLAVTTHFRNRSKVL